MALSTITARIDAEDKSRFDAFCSTVGLNTSAAVNLLRSRFPDTVIIGTEPALKPAAAQFPHGRILVMATARTLAEPKFLQLRAQFSADIVSVPCSGLMEFVERGVLDGPELDAFLEKTLAPFLSVPPDAVVPWVAAHSASFKRGAKVVDIAGVKREEIDMTFVRENSEGEYAGSGEWRGKGTPGETVVQHGVFTRKGCERIMRYAYELARKEGKTLTSISKGNALNYSMVFWDQVFKEVGAEYPDVKTQSFLVDAASMFMVKDPKRFQIVVASNLFGDILTDLGAAISGGMGLAAGANLNPERTFPSMFEPIHGSAPDIAGRGLANPLATVWSASQMLDFFGHADEAKLLLDVIEKLLVEKRCLTPDLGGTATTSQVGDAVVKEVLS